MRARTSAAASPRSSASPGRRLTTKTSARSASRSTISLPRRNSTATERLFAFAVRNIVAVPSWNGGPQCRASSPLPGGSTLITSAPNAPSTSVQYGPASDVVTSTTRRPVERAEHV